MCNKNPALEAAPILHKKLLSICNGNVVLNLSMLSEHMHADFHTYTRPWRFNVYDSTGSARRSVYPSLFAQLAAILFINVFNQQLTPVISPRPLFRRQRAHLTAFCCSECVMRCRRSVASLNLTQRACQLVCKEPLWKCVGAELLSSCIILLSPTAVDVCGFSLKEIRT